MPGFSRTGPAGAGPMTGGGRGFCGPETVGFPQRQWWGFARGPRRGCGRGFGWGYDFQAFQKAAFAPVPGYRSRMDAGAEMRILKDRAELLKTELDQIHIRLAELGKSKKPESE